VELRHCHLHNSGQLLVDSFVSGKAHRIWQAFSSSVVLQVLMQARLFRHVASARQPASCAWQLRSRQEPTSAASAASLGGGAAHRVSAAQDGEVSGVTVGARALGG
jgi:hypothetical protein